ncbi:MAG TPA: ASKHA domain-containing protein, partial [Phycisphaerae bacterium]|nr:ASKHA domain-containing protein [Phycisphaerae bacterium]
IARIDYASKSTANLRHLQRRAVGAISALADKLLAANNLPKKNLATVLVGGNTTMQHMLLGVDPSGIAVAPFTPAFTNPREESAANVGLKIAADGKLRVMPAISGYVGGDIVGDMLAVGWACPDCDRKDTELLIDIGTNGEIVMRAGDEIIACSTAAGPAFEGAKITCGTRAIPGAINSVDVVGDDIAVETIDGKKPLGICGTGLLDIVAVLLELGVIDAGGRMAVSAENLPSGVAKRLIPHADGGSAVVLADDVILTARDVREFQLAKAAIAAGVKVLLDLKGRTPANVDAVLLAGAMGSFLRPQNAIRTGLLPYGFKPAQIKAVGNTALEGAGLCLLSGEYRRSAEIISKSCQYVELSGRLDFQTAYMETMLFE